MTASVEPASSIERRASTGVVEEGRSRAAYYRGAPALTALFVCALAGALVCGGCSSSSKADAPKAAAPAAVVKVARHDLADRIEIASEFQPFQEIEVYAKVAGYIDKLNVDWGTHVKQGQVMAVLEVPELEQQLQQDEASVHRAESDLARAQEQSKQAEATYNVAHLNYTRLAEVQKTRPGLVAQQDVDVSQGKDQEASAGRSAAEAAQAAAVQAVAAAKAALEKDRVLYSYANITAPFEGVVTELDASKGKLLPAGTSSNVGTQRLCRLSQNDLLRLVIPVPERAVADIHVGQPIAVQVSALKKTLQGKIVRFSDQIDPQTRTMHTEVEVPNPKYELVPGMYASAEIPLHVTENALTVPVQSVQATGEGKGTVLVVTPENKIEARAVTLGLQSATQVEVLSGLKENEMVVYGEQGQYQPGQVVAPKLSELND
jgi:RND family efflux transporter MFP subunit